MGCLLKRNKIFYLVTSEQRGKRRWRSLRTSDDSEARALLEEHELDVKRRTRCRASDFFQDFLVRAPLNFSKKTVEMYARAFKTFLRLCENRLLTSIGPLDIEGFKALRAREVSPVSVNIELRTLRSAFNEAKRLKLIQENPFNGVKPVRVLDTEASHLSEPEFSTLLNAIEDTDFKNLVKFAVFTMMRLGEITSLRWDAVDLRSREMHIKSNGEFRVKGGKPRFVPMNDWVHAFLASKVRTGELVFSRNAKALKGASVSHRFKHYVRKAGLNDGIHFHSLRHTGISWLANKGVPQPFIQRIAGHSSLKVTDIYTHAEESSLFKAVNTFPSMN
jgi:integrase/recombinase XerD